MPFPKFGVAADPVIIDGDKILLMRRAYEPFKGLLEFPGGFMEEGETIEHACVREAKEETGLDVEPVEILGVYTGLGRDPRAQTVGIAFLCRPKNKNVEISEEATEAHWMDIDEIDISGVGFDHGKIIQDLRKWRKERGTYWSTRRIP